jgi:hypothetical protein
MLRACAGSIPLRKQPWLRRAARVPSAASDSRKDASGRGFEPEVIASQPFRDLFLRSLLPRLGGGISTGLRQEGFLMVAFGRLSGSQIRRSGEAIPRAGLSTRGRAVKVTP